MRRLAVLLIVAAVCAFGAGTGTSWADCHNGVSRERNQSGAFTNSDTIATTPTGGTVYGDGAQEQLDPGYLGYMDSNGHAEIEGNLDAAPNVQIDGHAAGNRIDWRGGANAGSMHPVDLCVNDFEVV